MSFFISIIHSKTFYSKKPVLNLDEKKKNMQLNSMQLFEKYELIYREFISLFLYLYILLFLKYGKYQISKYGNIKYQQKIRLYKRFHQIQIIYIKVTILISLESQCKNVKKCSVSFDHCAHFNLFRELDHCDPYEEFHDHPGRRFLSHFLQSDSEDTSLKQKVLIKLQSVS